MIRRLRFFKLPGLDLNQDKESQNLIAALFAPSAILANFSQMSMLQGSAATFLLSSIGVGKGVLGSIRGS